MSTDTDGSGDGERMQKIDVRVPAALLEQIDEEYPERGYSSRSEAVRDALRAWLDLPAELPEKLLAELAASREQETEQAETYTAAEIHELFGLTVDEADG